ncbi:hypothetical protein BH23GEM3_BH23GEM3_18610 [soil metagenome]
MIHPVVGRRAKNFHRNGKLGSIIREHWFSAVVHHGGVAFSTLLSKIASHPTEQEQDMNIVNVHAAKTHLSRLIEQACAGEEVIIARNNKPVVKLVSIEAPRPKRQFGALKGKVVVPDSFFDPLPEEELDAWDQ